MKQLLFYMLFAMLFVALLLPTTATAQNKVMQVYSGGNVVYALNASQVDSLTFSTEKPIEEDIIKTDKIFKITGGCATVTYQSRIGNDFDSALDSLIKKYEPRLNVLTTNGYYSGEGYDIDKEKIKVDFGYDNREFRLLTFTDKANIYRILFSGDVIDERGNYFTHEACDD